MNECGCFPINRHQAHVAYGLLFVDPCSRLTKETSKNIHNADITWASYHNVVLKMNIIAKKYPSPQIYIAEKF